MIGTGLCYDYSRGRGATCECVSLSGTRSMARMYVVHMGRRESVTNDHENDCSTTRSFWAFSIPGKSPVRGKHSLLHVSKEHGFR